MPDIPTAAPTDEVQAGGAKPIPESEFMRIARERYHLALEEDREDREDAREDVRFAAGGLLQWDKDIIDQRKGGVDPTTGDIIPARPILTWNQLNGPIAQVVNEARANNPSIKVSPLNDGDPDTAKHLQGRIRQIEYESDADIAYDTASEQQVTCGRGFLKATTEYDGPRSFRQKIVIGQIEDQFSVLWDPAAKEYDKSDGEFWFITGQRLSKDVFLRRYGKEKFDKYSTFTPDDSSKGSWSSDWKKDSLYPNVEYWYKSHKTIKIYELSTGAVVSASELKELSVSNPNVSEMIVDERDDDEVTVTQYIIDGAQILEENEFLIDDIPIVPFWGRKMAVDGKLRNKGLIRDSKDAQRTINITISTIAELTNQLPKTPIEAAEGTIENPEDWQPISKKLIRYYKPMVNGQLVPKPERPNVSVDLSALTMQLKMAIDAVKQSTNVFNAALGDRSNETSGIAISQRKVESDTANMNFADNANRGRRTLGRIIIKLIEALDDGEEKEVPVRDEQGNTTLDRINTAAPVETEYGKKKHVRIGNGKYDVAISTGPSYQSEREQNAQTILAMTKVDPNVIKVAGDILYTDLGMEQIGERYAEAVIPEQFRKPKEGQPAIPPQAATMLAKSKEMIAALTDQLNKAKDELNQKGREQDIRLLISQMQEETKRQIASGQLNQNENLALMRSEMEGLKHSMELSLEHRQQDFAESQAAMAANQPQGPEMTGQESTQ